MLRSYPLWTQFQEQFGTEEACAQALFAARWPDGFRCPRCDHAHAYVIHTRHLLECKACRYQASLTAGTVFHSTRTPLTKWFVALFLLHHGNITARALQKIIRVTYKTAWLMLMKLRCAMSEEESAHLLTGTVQACTDLFQSNVMNFGSELTSGEHLVVVGASFDQDGAFTQIKIKEIPAVHYSGMKPLPSSIDDFVEKHVDPDCRELQTVYKRFPPHPIRKLLKPELWRSECWVYASHRYFQMYMDEYCFRYNTKRRFGEDIVPWLQLIAHHKARTYPEIVRLQYEDILQGIGTRTKGWAPPAPPHRARASDAA